MKNKNIKILLLSFLVISLFLSGCGKKQKTNIEDTQNNDAFQTKEEQVGEEGYRYRNLIYVSSDNTGIEITISEKDAPGIYILSPNEKEITLETPGVSTVLSEDEYVLKIENAEKGNYQIKYPIDMEDKFTYSASYILPSPEIQISSLDNSSVKFNITEISKINQISVSLVSSSEDIYIIELLNETNTNKLDYDISFSEAEIPAGNYTLWISATYDAGTTEQTVSYQSEDISFGEKE